MATRRTREEIIQDLDGKITYHEDCIAKLKVKKAAAQQPPKTRVRKTSMRAAMEAVKDAGLTPDEIVTMVKKAQKVKK